MYRRDVHCGGGAAEGSPTTPFTLVLKSNSLVVDARKREIEIESSRYKRHAVKDGDI